MSHTLRHNLGLPFLTAVIFVAFGGMVRVQAVYGFPLSGSSMLQTIGWYLLAFVAYLGALILVERRRGLAARWIWGTAVCFRLVFLLASPTLSNDVYRYLWDGYVANQGISPYAHAIDAPELDSLDIPQRHMANHTWMASPYLPGAQLLFWVLAFVFPLEPIIVQIVMIVFDLLSAWLLVKLLDLVSLPRHRILLYLWNPLVIVEIAYSAHLDAWMNLLSLAAVYLTVTSSEQLIKKDLGTAVRRGLAPCFLALATLTKIVPALLLPVLYWRWSWRQRILYGLLCLGLLLPPGLRAGWGVSGPLSGTGLFGALRIYTAQWNFNSSLFHWLERWLGAPGYGPPNPAARLIALSLMVVVIFLVWLLARSQRGNREMLRLATAPLIAYVMLSTTIHPWYILILLAFLPFLSPGIVESRWRWFTLAPWLYLSGALALSYITYLDPLKPGEIEWVRQVEWLPVVGLLIITYSLQIFTTISKHYKLR